MGRSGLRTGLERQQGSSNTSLLERILAARLLVLAPHMDDETLACGGTMLLHGDKGAIHLLFATDSAGSPAPPLPWLGKIDPDLAARRREEAHAVAECMGIARENLHFLGLPDGGLARRRSELRNALAATIARIRPEYVFAPFRYDVHPDHVALNRAARAVLRALEPAPVLMEYFVYHKLRFVAGEDVRQSLREGALLTVDIAPVAAAKLAALDRYVSQTTLQYPWQDRPILTAQSLYQRCAEPEFFLPSNPAAPLAQDFADHHARIRLAAFAMRHGKPPKDRAAAFLRWMLGR